MSLSALNGRMPDVGARAARSVANEHGVPVRRERGEAGGTRPAAIRPVRSPAGPDGVRLSGCNLLPTKVGSGDLSRHSRRGSPVYGEGSADARSFTQRGLIQRYGALLIRLGYVLDGGIILSVLYLAVALHGAAWQHAHFSAALFGILVFGSAASFRHMYRSWRLVRLRRELLEVLLLWSGAFGFTALALFFVLGWPDDPVSRGIVAYWYAGTLGGIVAARIAVRLALRYYRAFGRDRRRVALVGATAASRRLAGIFDANQWMGIEVVGVYDDRISDGERHDYIPLSDIAGDVQALLDLARRGAVSAVYIALPLEAGKRIKQIVDRFAAETTVSIHYCPPLFDFELVNARWDDVFGTPVITVVDSPLAGYGNYAKRLEDLVLALLALPFLLLPMGVIAAAVKLTSPGPVLFRQTRNGLDGREFKIWKFRTMYAVETDEQFVQAKKDDARITRLGRFLRETSLDELPQFFNVLMGDMSIVGPRPAPIKYNEAHRGVVHRYMARHKVKPGITGWAQIHGYRGETETLAQTEKRTEYDLQYMRNWSVWLDVRILFKTCWLLLSDMVSRRSPAAETRIATRSGTSRTALALMLAALSGLALLLAACNEEGEPADRPDRMASQGGWTMPFENPVIKAGDLRPKGLWNDPSVLKESGRYVMYMTTSVEEPFKPPIVPFRAVSSDGVRWQLDPPTPVAMPTGTQFQSVETPSVVRFRDRYHMFFTGTYAKPNPAPMAIGHATSPDGINWTVKPGPVIAATGRPHDWNGFLVAEPGAIVRGNQIFVYFNATGARTGGKPPQDQSIGLVRTEDGENFSAPVRVLTQSPLFPADKGFTGYSTPAAAEINGRVHLFYDVALFQKGGNPEWQQVALHHAVSTGDGQGDFVQDQQPIFTRNDFSWTAGEILAPAVLAEDGQVKLWFAGHVRVRDLGPLIRRGIAGGEFGIGFATRPAAGY